MGEASKIVEPNVPVTAEADWFLQNLVHIANQSDLGIGITLQVSGMLVSGSLVSGKKYFAGFADEFSNALSEAVGAEAAEPVRSAIARHSEIYASASDQQDESTPPPQYLHLENARFFSTTGQPVPGNRGVWWRGRVCEVAGFILGTLEGD